ncbi:hypothetical protein QJQ45_000251 [Haematococcus lacustris]|nr:hypothetical protein QJQ45_000251 [Haematococcus lacustris]
MKGQTIKSPGERSGERTGDVDKASRIGELQLKRRANRIGPIPPQHPKLSTDINAVSDELQEEPQQEQHLRSAAFLPRQERRERSDAAARSNSEQRKREYVESAPQHQERLAAQMTALQPSSAGLAARPTLKRAFLEALNAAHHPLALYPPHQIRTDSFSQAFFDYLRAIDRILSMPSLNAQTYRPNSPEEHSVTVPSVRSSQATRDLEQHTDTYLDRSGLEGAVQQLHDRTVGQPVQIGIGKGQAPTRLPSISLSADMAQLQLRVLRGPHKQRMAAAKLKCMELETAHGVHAFEKEKHHGSAEGESPLIARGLKVEQLTNDVHELMLQRDCMGQSDKDPCAASNAIKAKLKTARQLLREAALRSSFRPW